MKTMDDLFVHTLRDVYYAEKKALKGMRAMQRKAASDELASLIEAHREETEGQIETLTKVFESLGLRPRGVTCDAINGIVDEAQELMEESADDAVRDAAIAAAAQAVEHYEIARYGTLVSWAETLGHADAASMLSQIRDQEIAADRKLTKLATGTLNAAARGTAAEPAESDDDAPPGENAEMEADDDEDEIGETHGSQRKPSGKAKRSTSKAA
ncbi:hypothetical protein DLJ53_07985 [Acuticoccus sediminis]|uniref:Ferritin-like metal-binding protein YciE n=1 Tax=Acuticoccus sediminis TaxID=2184697 RepID=A0A8B2P258_9HYPH|nr:hypothetical protein DLJ53_07985 [Acuticoccus sediminis]